MQGLFVPYACVGSGDPVRVLRLFHNKYSGYCCIHLLCKAMYNLSLPRLSANYYGLPTTVQLRAAHESRCSLFGVSRSTAQVLYCTCLEGYILGPFTIILVFWNVALLQTVIQKCEGKIYSGCAVAVLAIQTILYEIISSHCCQKKVSVKSL